MACRHAQISLQRLQHHTMTKVCNKIEDVTRLENELAAKRAEYSTAQDESMKAILTWFKAWRHTEAAKAIREHTHNFTRVYSAPTPEDTETFNGIRAHMVEIVWSPATMTTPSKWSNAIKWAAKVAEGKLCKNLSNDASKLTKAEAVARAFKLVNKAMNTPFEDRAMECWFMCKNGNIDDSGLLALEVEMSK